MALAAAPTAEIPPLPLSPARLRECRDCGLLQVIPPMPPAARALCLRCDCVLRHTRRDPLQTPLALALTGLILLAIGTSMGLMTVSRAGEYRSATLFTGPSLLGSDGRWDLAAIVLAATFAAPLARLLATTVVLIAARLNHRSPQIRMLFAWVERLQPWSMVEVYMLGVFVAYVRLGSLVHIEIGPGLYALAGLILTMVACDATLDPEAVWEVIGRRLTTAARADRGYRAAALRRLGCDTCGFVVRALPGALCPRCGFALIPRKHDSLARTWALGIAAIVLYIPANLYPVLTVTQLGSDAPSTILGGVRELLDIGEWPLAALVFFASIAVPVLKIIGLSILLIGVHRGARTHRRDRTVLYRIVDRIGRWSMIDIFMLSILVALLQFGSIVSVHPGMGAVAFVSVVILTMLAARTFDPRLIWDAAGDNGRPA
ncbi:MAG TPA: paraquat-inducible protein A [Acetobacteraceae bacterium]|jgi:paraquat-inducible protein A